MGDALPAKLTADAELERWRDLLREQRQPWPEWEALEGRVGAGRFDLIDVDPPGFRFLVERDPPEDLPPLVHLIPEEETAFPAVFAPHVLALIDLKCADLESESEEDRVMMAGGIACCYPGNPTTELFADEAMRSFLGASDDFPIARARGFVDFQTTRSGGYFFADKTSDIHVFDPDKEKFIRIGARDSFLRYCLAFVLNGVDWFEAGYSERLFLKEYGLKFVAGAGED